MLTAALTFFTALWGGVLTAAEVTVTPSIGVRQEFNDNIFFSSSDEIDDAVTTISPGLAAVRRTERLDARLTGTVDKRLYRDNGELEETDYNVVGRIRYDLSERLSVSGDAGYLKDSQPDREAETTGILLGIEKRDRYSVSGSAEYELSELSRATFSYSFSDEDWDNPTLNDTTAHSLNLGLTRSLEGVFQNTWGRLNAGYAHYDYTSSQSFSDRVFVVVFPFIVETPRSVSIDEKNKTDSYSLTAGAQHRFSETWSLLVDFGGGYVQTDEETSLTQRLPQFSQFDKASETLTSERFSYIGAVELDYAGERTTAAFRARHDIGAPSGSVGATQRTGLSLRLRRRFTGEFSGSLNVSYVINTADNEDLRRADTDRQTFGLSPELRFDLTDDIVLVGGYRFSWSKDDIDDSDSIRNLIYGGVSAGWDLTF